MKHASIFLISKKPKFTGKLMHTRPISLIEHTKKIFTKIITTRIANVICRYLILSKYNHVAIPNTSTALPISTLTHIINDAHANKKELWMLSQDMSKAYDTVYIPLLIKALERIKIPKEICQLVNNIFAERHNSVIELLTYTQFTTR